MLSDLAWAMWMAAAWHRYASSLLPGDDSRNRGLAQPVDRGALPMDSLRVIVDPESWPRPLQIGHIERVLESYPNNTLEYETKLS